MGKKYIVELEDNQMAYATTIIDVIPYIKPLPTLPYTEPDLEQVRKEAFEEGKKQAKVQAELDVCHDIEKVAKANYQQGLNDIWEAARKIAVIPYVELEKIFGATGWHIFMKCTASEVIEKIRKYEQGKQEKDAEIKVGKEFQIGERKCVVTHIIDGTQRRVLWDNGVSSLVDNTDLFVNLTPTGRYFPEIAAVLDKMRSST